MLVIKFASEMIQMSGFRKPHPPSRMLSILLLISIFSTSPAEATDLDTKCKDEASRFLSQRFPESSPSALLVRQMKSHYNKRRAACLVSISTQMKPSPAMSVRERDALSNDKILALIDVSNSRELAHFAGFPDQPSSGCRIQSIQMQDESCSWLAEYEAFVTKAMSE